MESMRDLPRSIPITGPWTLASDSVDSYRANLDARGALAMPDARLVMGEALGSCNGKLG